MRVNKRWAEYWAALACAVGLHEYGAPIVDTARIYVRCMRCHHISCGISTNGQRHDAFEPARLPRR